MKTDKPIIFNSEMVRAVLENRKTQTRIPIKTKVPIKEGWLPSLIIASSNIKNEGMFQFTDSIGVNATEPFKAPYKIGDKLWVRETTGVQVRTIGGGTPHECLIYRADSTENHYCIDCDGNKVGRIKWKPSIHMPRWASRITLEVTGVRIERVKGISNEDAEKEGVYAVHSQSPGMESVPYYRSLYPPKELFRMLWDSIYKEKVYGCDANHWVWVVEFKRIKEVGNDNTRASKITTK